jgi:hypothetical protein
MFDAISVLQEAFFRLGRRKWEGGGGRGNGSREGGGVCGAGSFSGAGAPSEWGERVAKYMRKVREIVKRGFGRIWIGRD